MYLLSGERGNRGPSGETGNTGLPGAAGKLENRTHITLNPLSPHDALKHHLKSLKTDLIFLQPRLL